MDLTTVCVTDRIETGWRHINEARLTTGLTIYGFLSAVEKNLFFFLPTKPPRNPCKKRSDHSFYHRQTRNTRKQWTKKARGASVLERKRHESTQSAREDRPTSVGVVEAARSSRVTQTKKPSSFVQDAQIRRLFFIKNDLFLSLLHNRIRFASKSEFCLAFFLRIFYEFIPEFSPNALRKALK